MSAHQGGGSQAKAKSGQMWTGGVGVVSQMWWTGQDRGGGVPKIPKFVLRSFMDDPLF